LPDREPRRPRFPRGAGDVRGAGGRIHGGPTRARPELDDPVPALVGALGKRTRCMRVRRDRALDESRNEFRVAVEFPVAGRDDLVGARVDMLVPSAGEPVVEALIAAARKVTY